MRGSPLLRAFIAFFALLLLGWPIWNLTRPVQAATEVSAAPEAAPEKAIGLHLTFSSLPKSFTVKHLDKTVWTETAPKLDMNRQVAIAYPKEGVDLVLHVEWPDGAPQSALRVQLTDPSGDTHEKSVWGSGSDDEVITFP